MWVHSDTMGHLGPHDDDPHHHHGQGPSVVHVAAVDPGEAPNGWPVHVAGGSS